LKDLAKREGVTLPDSLDAKDQATYDRLSKLSGTEFDREYMRDMVKDHQMDVSEFRRESESAKETNVREFAKQTLPTLEEHLNLAKQDSSQIGISSRK
jgi:putative membrane protein